MDIGKKLQILKSSKEFSTEEKLEQELRELEIIKKQWADSLADLNEQRKKYKELNEELFKIKKEMVKLKNFL
jgi:hypothetical protein